MDLLTLAAVALLALGVVGTVVPLVPGALVSLAGVYLYWWHTGFADPGALALAGFTLVGLLALFVDWFGGAVGAGAGGAPMRTSIAAGLVGVVGVLAVGPVGLLVGVALTTFALEYRRNEEARRSARAAVYATVGVLASTVMQVVITATMLVAFLLVVLL